MFPAVAPAIFGAFVCGDRGVIALVGLICAILRRRVSCRCPRCRRRLRLWRSWGYCPRGFDLRDFASACFLSLLPLSSAPSSVAIAGVVPRPRSIKLTGPQACPLARAPPKVHQTQGLTRVPPKVHQTQGLTRAPPKVHQTQGLTLAPPKVHPSAFVCGDRGVIALVGLTCAMLRRRVSCRCPRYLRRLRLWRSWG